jgi:hypothetical protein
MTPGSFVLHFLAAAAVVIAATAATVIGVVSAVIAAAVAQQEDEDDDPAHITAAQTVVATEITHKNTSMFLMRPSMPLIPWYSCGRNWCKDLKLSIIVDFFSAPIP